MSETRLVAVLGYSDGSRSELHAICAARLRRAETEARPDDIVLLSGWARGRDGTSEAELMARSWTRRGNRIVLDRRPRSTLGNALGVAELARREQAREVLLVTSSWHARRAGALLRLALRGSGTTVTIVATDEYASPRTRVRELAAWMVAPVAALAARRR
jgi:uncharacterized SAM-binding protein YcdF (DUF218 family)